MSLKRKHAEVESITEEMCDIERILKERGKGKKKEYLCSWMDGAEPQWIISSYLEGSIALEEWKEAEEEIEEIYDPEDILDEKIAKLVEWMKSSPRTSYLVGAGISSSVLPTFRGIGGLWTKGAPSLIKKVNTKKKNKEDDEEYNNNKIKPTLTHRALVLLEKGGYVNHVASQNYDDLFNLASFPSNKLSELHGNIYTETCDKCIFIYHRDYEVELSTSSNHETGRLCENKECNGILRDNIVHFGESLPWNAITT